MRKFPESEGLAGFSTVLACMPNGQAPRRLLLYHASSFMLASSQLGYFSSPPSTTQTKYSDIAMTLPEYVIAKFCPLSSPWSQDDTFDCFYFEKFPTSAFFCFLRLDNSEGKFSQPETICWYSLCIGGRSWMVSCRSQCTPTAPSTAKLLSRFSFPLTDRDLFL